MTKKTTPELEKPHVLEAQGAAQELIGKLVGDDAQVDQGRAKQQKAGAASKSTQSTTKE